MNFTQRFEQQRAEILDDCRRFLSVYPPKKLTPKYVADLRSAVAEHIERVGYFTYSDEERARLDSQTTTFADEEPSKIPSRYLSQTLEDITRLAKDLRATQSK